MSLPTKATIRIMDDKYDVVGEPIECEVRCQILVGRRNGKKGSNILDSGAR